MGDFEAPIATTTGEPCKSCIKLERLCPAHTEDEFSKPAIHGEWEDKFVSFLELGHSKASAAAMAGVSESGYQYRYNHDPEFAQRVDIAYGRGTATLEDIAFDRITDRNKPGDSILKQLLISRGIDGTKKHEISGPDGGPIETSTIPFEMLSLELRRKILAELEQIEKKRLGMGDPVKLPDAELLP